MMQLYRKKTKALVQLLLLLPFLSFAQCPPGNVFLATQAEVAQFAIDYPNCTQITGNLTIGGGISSAPGTLTDVSPISNITSITGNLFIQNNAALQNLNGLNIITVGGRLYIGGDNANNSNSQLQNVNGLSSLTSIGQFLQVRYNPLLTNLNGLSNITNVGLDIEIEGNTLLNDISGLDGTTFNPNDGYGLTIKNNPALAVCNLPNFCTYLAKLIATHPRDISGNLAACVNEAAVTAACGISQCPPGNITLTTQAQVNQFAIDYPNCTQINGYLTVGGSNITNLNGLSNLTSTVGSLDITQNPLLTDISGLSNITSVGQELAIRNNAVLQSIISLSNINTVTGGLWISGNPQLQSLNGLQNIHAVGGGGLIIRNNDALQSISVLSGIITVTGEVSIREHALLQNLDGLQNINAVGENLVITDNDALQNISNLSSITTVDGALWILRNPQLQTLNGLQNIVEVGGDVDISNNAVLNNISALQNIDPTSITELDGFGLTIVDNPNVSVCNLQNICTYLTYPAATHPRAISGNMAACVNLAAVTTACAAMSIDEFDSAIVTAYPNPVENLLNLSSAYEITNVTIINMLGQTVLNKAIGSADAQIDMGHLPAGNYFVRASTERAVKTIKVVKQ